MASPTTSTPADCELTITPSPEDVTDVLSSPLFESGCDADNICMTGSQAFNLYTTHFLSTWNVRTYEFAAIIFTASAYPDTLVAASIRGIVRTVASICFSSAVGRWVDRAPDRLQTLTSTISLNRIGVIAASALWFFIVSPAPSESDDTFIYTKQLGSFTSLALLRDFLFPIILLLSIIETLSASGNMLSMERDWVLAAASPDGQSYDLTHLNSVMRRIDLLCKLLAPILISVVVSVTSVRAGVLVVGSMSAVSWAVEIWCARRVWSRNPRLQQRKSSALEGLSGELELERERASLQISRRGCWSRTGEELHRYVTDFRNYFSSVVWIPSLSLAFLHISALTYSATFITYLLTMGFSLDLITFARAAGSVVEISSTVVTPVGVQLLSKARNHGRFRGEDIHDGAGTILLEDAQHEESRTETGLERLGLWGISFQLINLTPVVFALWQLSPSPAGTPSTLPRLLALPSQPLLAFTLFFFLSISRLGLWIYDLTTQQLTQTMVPPRQRSSFTGVEYSFVSVFELAQYVLTIVLHRPEQFRWIALGSWVAVLVSAAAYAGWVWRMRGHLVHWGAMGKRCRCLPFGHGR